MKKPCETYLNALEDAVNPVLYSSMSSKHWLLKEVSQYHDHDNDNDNNNDDNLYLFCDVYPSLPLFNLDLFNNLKY